MEAGSTCNAGNQVLDHGLLVCVCSWMPLGKLSWSWTARQPEGSIASPKLGTISWDVGFQPLRGTQMSDLAGGTGARPAMMAGLRS
jgi:hypothetical protein